MMRAMIPMFAMLLLTACPEPTDRGTAPDTPRATPDPQPGGGMGLSGNQQQDSETILRLSQEARQLARADGCSGAAECAAAPLGAKACGGPREYVTFCRVTTDTTALMAKLSELQRFEQEFNERYGVVSDCMLVMEPQLDLVDGVCVAVQ